jgi:hypothetical protein
MDTFSDVPFMGRFVYLGACYVRCSMPGKGDCYSAEHGGFNAVCYDAGDGDRGIWCFRDSDEVVLLS